MEAQEGVKKDLLGSTCAESNMQQATYTMGLEELVVRF